MYRATGELLILRRVVFKDEITCTPGRAYSIRTAHRSVRACKRWIPAAERSTYQTASECDRIRLCVRARRTDGVPIELSAIRAIAQCSECERDRGTLAARAGIRQAEVGVKQTAVGRLGRRDRWVDDICASICERQIERADLKDAVRQKECSCIRRRSGSRGSTRRIAFEPGAQQEAVNGESRAVVQAAAYRACGVEELGSVLLRA